MNVKPISLSEIHIGERSRKDLGDLTSLMVSMGKRGLINPITVDTKNNLICGERRLASAQSLGWEEIDCHVVSSVDELVALHLEKEENECRLEPSVEERYRMAKRIEERLKPEAEQRLADGQKQGGRGHKKTLPPDGGRVSASDRKGKEVSQIAGSQVGLHGGTYWRVKSVVDAAEKNPKNDAIREAKDEMNKTGVISPAYEKVRTELNASKKGAKPKENKVDRRGLPRSEDTPIESRRALETIQHAVAELEKMKLDTLKEEDATVLSDGIRSVRTRLFRILNSLKGNCNGEDD